MKVETIAIALVAVLVTPVAVRAADCKPSKDHRRSTLCRGGPKSPPVHLLALPHRLRSHVDPHAGLEAALQA